MTDLSRAAPFKLIDADNHYYEQDDCFTRYLPKQFSEMAIRLTPGGSSLNASRPITPRRFSMGDHAFSFLSRNQADEHLRPGALAAFLEGRSDRTADVEDVISPLRDYPEMIYRGPRIKLMDAQNLESCIMLPSAALLVEPEFHDNPQAVCVNIKSFNCWLEEEWGFGRDGRIFAVPMISLLDPNWAVEELARVKDAGARFVYLGMGPVGSRSPADPVFDAFWDTVQETRVTPIFHVTDSQYCQWFATRWSEESGRPNDRWTAFQIYSSLVDRPIQDTLAALILQNLFGRFPRVQILVVECGSSWVDGLLKMLDKSYRMAPRPTWGKELPGTPSEIFREHISISPYPEDDIPSLVNTIGPNRVLFGSDWPHPEGLSKPFDYAARLASLEEPVQRRILRDNAAGLVGLEG